LSLLAHSRIGGPGAAHWTVFLHGILGRRANWRTVARRLVLDVPGRAALLVDLRMHGDSQDFSPPHTVDAAARDLVELGAALGLAPRTIVGHSFGGKVALAWAARAPEVSELWLVDSMPGARELADEPGSPAHVLGLLRGLPDRFARRDSFVEQLRAAGLSASVADWLAMNLRAEGPEYRLGLDLGAIEDLLRDYARRDDWATLEHPRPGLRTHVVIAGRSSVWNTEDRARARALADRGRLALHVLPEVGHWVHVEAPEQLLGRFRSDTR
jgi:pimeloyl-ACP methyl ester carboxylesterase